MAAPESRGFGLSPIALSALALVIFVGAMMWALAGPSDEAEAVKKADEPAEETHAAAAPDQQPTAKVATPDTTPQKPAEPAVDLFAGEMPDFMANAHARVLDKKPLGVVEQKALYDYGKANPTDARPQLLLAWDSMGREWDGIAVRMYRIAFRADARAKQDPSMLRDLIKIASTHDRVEYRETTEIMREAYGSEAIGAIDEEIERLRASNKPQGVDRLERLREALSK